MRHFLAALFILVASEGVALACSCLPPTGNAELRREAVRSLRAGAVALVEVELLTPYRSEGPGEQMRVRRTLAGRAPETFEIERDGPPSSAGCDIEFDQGGAGLILLYPARQPGNERNPVYRISSLCAAILLGNANIRSALIREWGRRR